MQRYNIQLSHSMYTCGSNIQIQVFRESDLKKIGKYEGKKEVFCSQDLPSPHIFPQLVETPEVWSCTCSNSLLSDSCQRCMSDLQEYKTPCIEPHCGSHRRQRGVNMQTPIILCQKFSTQYFIRTKLYDIILIQHAWSLSH